MKTSITRLLLILSAATLLCMPAQIFASVSNDQVLSQHVKEADGTSGQNTNSGSGIKTGHIQDGAVADAKITGPISASKISFTGLNADTVDGKHAADLALVGHNHDSVYQKKYGKMAVVAQSGGDYTNPVAAMNDLATWCGTSSATNPCLLKIMPGIYTLGTTLMMTSYVDMEGSGANTTKFVGTVRYEYITNNELRMLTVESAGAAIEMYGSNSLAIRDTSLVASSYGLSMEYSGPVTLKHVDISAGSDGIFSYYPYGDVLIEDSVISAGGSYGFREGSYNGGSGNLYIKNSKLTALHNVVSLVFYNLYVIGSDLLTQPPTGDTSDAIYCGYGLNVTVRDSVIKATRNLFLGDCAASIANTLLDGPAPAAKCFGVYDANYNPVVCQ